MVAVVVGGGGGGGRRRRHEGQEAAVGGAGEAAGRALALRACRIILSVASLIELKIVRFSLSYLPIGLPSSPDPELFFFD